MTVAKRASAEEMNRLFQAFADTSKPDEIQAFMDDLCTIKELHDMAQRLNVAYMLDSGESYVAIQEKTGASATTIARVSKCLNYGAGGYRLVIDRES